MKNLASCGVSSMHAGDQEAKKLTTTGRPAGGREGDALAGMAERGQGEPREGGTTRRAWPGGPVTAAVTAMARPAAVTAIAILCCRITRSVAATLSRRVTPCACQAFPRIPYLTSSS